MRAVLGLGGGMLALLGATAGVAQQPQPPATPRQYEVTLNEAIQRALGVQPAMIQAHGDERNAGAAKRSAFGAFIPTVSLGSSAARANIGRIDQTTGRPVPAEYSYTGSFNASLDLFDGFRRFANLKASSATGAAADAGIVNQRFQVTLQTKQLFYNAIATEALVRVAEAQVARAQQQLQISIEKLHAGSATRSDSLRSTVEYGNARIDLLTAQANLATAQANLGRQVGVDGLVRAVPDTTLPAMPDTAELRRLTISDFPAVEQAEAQASAARAQIWSARSQYWPTVTVSYSNNRQGTETLNGSPNFPFFGNYPETFQWRFALNWPILNGFVREQNQVTASVNRDIAEARAADTRRQANAQLTQQLAVLQTAFEQITIADANLAAAQEDLRVQNERYRVGAATILDLLTSQAALTQAEVNRVQTRFNYLIARSQLEATVGRTL
ncbi:MAG TPA: TolC family protein [Gemmatimonadales bacterium]|nr:TolC family protein [Gemmatimonadales bacterium]